MSVALARYLKDFGDPEPVQAVVTDFGLDNFSASETADFGDFAISEPADPETLRQQAYAEGYETASAELSLRHEQAVDSLNSLHALELEELREQFQTEASARITAGLQQMALELADHISGSLALCLAPLLQEEISRKAVADMSDLVREAILEGEAGPIIVKGPLSLFNILATEMGEDASLLRHVEAADLDLSVEIAGSVLVTRMSAFAASLKKVLE